MDRQGALDELYDMLAEAERRMGGLRTLDGAGKRDGWPDQGVYLFFEPGEHRLDGTTLRVVRVGTQGLTGSGRSTLWTRLSQHKGADGGWCPGGGNHRGSVFRLHVGGALINAGRIEDPGGQWGVGGSAPRPVRETECPIEQAVSQVIRQMPLIFIPVHEQAHRAAIERGMIGLLSNYQRTALDPPSLGWLGHHSWRPGIRESGLWNINFVDAPPDDKALPLLRSYVESW